MLSKLIPFTKTYFINSLRICFSSQTRPCSTLWWSGELGASSTAGLKERRYGAIWICWRAGLPRCNFTTRLMNIWSDCPPRLIYWPHPKYSSYRLVPFTLTFESRFAAAHLNDDSCLQFSHWSKADSHCYYCKIWILSRTPPIRSTYLLRVMFCCSRVSHFMCRLTGWQSEEISQHSTRPKCSKFWVNINSAQAGLGQEAGSPLRRK